MFRPFKKFIAVLMLLWLPLSTASALAATVSMQMPQGDCHEPAAAHAMPHDATGGHHLHHGSMPATTDQHSPSCSACGVCHLAGAGYLAVPGVELSTVQTAARDNTPYLVVFNAVPSSPLVPPPLVRA
jgi:hypothetical protein